MNKIKVLCKNPDAYSGWMFLEEDGGGWDTVDEAVKAHMSSWASTYEFKLIKEIEWKAVENE